MCFVREVRDDCREAWAWMTPRVREALIAEKCLAVVRATHRNQVNMPDVDLLFNAMRVAAGLATLEEVT
jgi:hypothetical protein